MRILARCCCLLLAISGMLFAGCSEAEDSGKIEAVPPAQAGSQLESAFQTADAATKQNVSVASEAMRKGEYDRAIMSLQTVKQSESLTLDQGMAVHRSVISLERELISAMEAGDKRAAAAYQLLKAMNRN